MVIKYVTFHIIDEPHMYYYYVTIYLTYLLGINLIRLKLDLITFLV